jgi:hypothetical protein
MRKLMETPIDGVKIIPNESDITDIQAIIEGPGTSFPSHRSLIHAIHPPNRFIQLIRPTREVLSESSSSWVPSSLPPHPKVLCAPPRHSP